MSHSSHLEKGKTRTVIDKKKIKFSICSVICSCLKLSILTLVMLVVLEVTSGFSWSSMFCIHYKLNKIIHKLLFYYEN